MRPWSRVGSCFWSLLATDYLYAVDSTTRFVDGCTACRDLQALVLRAGSLEPGRPERTTVLTVCVCVCVFTSAWLTSRILGDDLHNVKCTYGATVRAG